MIEVQSGLLDQDVYMVRCNNLDSKDKTCQFISLRTTEIFWKRKP